MAFEVKKKASITLPGTDIEQIARDINPIIALILYICSEEPDYKGGAPSLPQPKKTKKGWRLFPPDKPTVWVVGETIGNQIRTFSGPQGGTHQGPRPHVRSAHWHGFWTGPRDGEQKFIYKWLPPTPVNVSGDR